MLVLIPVIKENKWFLNYLCPFFPSDSEHSDAQLCYIGCSPKNFIGYRETENLYLFEVSAILFRSFDCHINFQSKSADII
jgi:hypothetical protein